MYVQRRPSGLSAAPAPVRQIHISPWLFIGGAIVFFAGKAMLKKVRR